MVSPESQSASSVHAGAEGCAATGATVSSGPALLPWVMAGPMTLLKPRFVMMSLAPDTIKGIECWCQESGPPTVSMVVSKSLPATWVMPIQVACTATWGQAQTAAVGHVWIRCQTAVRVQSDVDGLCYHRGS